jgi:cell wall-associated NlpC family hydrolase
MIRRRGRLTSRAIRALASLLVVGFAVGSVVSIPDAHADGVSDQKKKIQQLAAELNNLNDRIAQLADDYGAAQDRKAQLDVEIKASQAKVADEQAQLDQLRGVMADIAVGRFVGNNTTGLSPLFSSAQAYSQAQQLDALSNIAFDTGAANADNVQSLVRQFNTDTTVLQRKQAEATTLIAMLAKKKSDGEGLVKVYQQKVKDAKAKYGQLVQDEAQRQAELAQTRAAAAARAAASAAGAAAAGPGPRGGGGKPFDNGASIPIPPPPSGKAGIAIAAAHSVVGVPYVAFQASPETGFDCSGLTSWAWAQAGVMIPHQSGRQYASLPHVPIDQAQPGDLVFFYNPIHHVGIYIGGGLMIDSPFTGATVRVAGMRWDMVVGVARPG